MEEAAIGSSKTRPLAEGVGGTRGSVVASGSPQREGGALWPFGRFGQRAVLPFPSVRPMTVLQAKQL